MNPIAVQIGNIPIHWYGVIMASAFLAGLFVAYQRAIKTGVNPEHILNIVTLAIPAGIIGARIYYVIFEWEQYRDNIFEALAVWHGGLAIHGGLIGGILVGYLYVRKQHLNFWQLGDLVAPSIILGQSIGRWGNFINQEAHGGPVSKSFISNFPSFIQNQMFINGQYYHPTFLYESLWDFSIFIFLYLYLARKKFHGQILLLYLGLYSLGRLFIEGLRTDSLMLGNIRVAQLMSLTLIAISIGMYFYRSSKADKF
ncbi:prolipoprotein diacylglyceryl transferase [Desulfolucanica intricata]|uniref:prolipoprotein diacylglyceryl transferase n=1 Tax=Desulfolucanica intricata TaxID=1285191 RepID=UPI001EE4D9C1|nr:prolipoprotein diacylglyceryl transferase [Desulfolucanica intricata]